MNSIARFDLKLSTEDKDAVARAAALMGTTMAAFVRIAAQEKARALLERETRIVLTARDFEEFGNAINGAFSPNPALKKAMSAARKVKRD